MDNFPHGIKDFSYVQSNIPKGIEDFPYGKTVNPSVGQGWEVWRSTFHRKIVQAVRKVYKQKTIASSCTGYGDCNDRRISCIHSYAETGHGKENHNA